MKKEIILCDNCGAEMAGKGGNVAVGVRRPLDVCDRCVAGGRDLTSLAFDEWPRVVHRDDVRGYLEEGDRARMLLVESNTKLAEDLARAERRAGGRGRDLALDLLNLAAGKSPAELRRDVEALQDRARRLV